ncbi:Pam16-domain-containing protein, partial [Pavlovales sp. CCMP2436]
RLIANIMVMGGGALGRAFMDAYKQALQSAYPAHGGGAAKAGARGAVRGGGISTQEARSILDVKFSASQVQVEEAFSRLHSMNEPARGGSAYLQSKIANARSALSDASPPSEDAP